MKSRAWATLVGLCLFAAAPVAAAEDKSVPPVLGGFLAVDPHYDSRGRVMTTFRTLMILPHRMDYFGLLNLFNPLDSAQDSDLSLYYTEQNLAWQPHEGLPLAPNLQWVSTSDESNDLMRLGVRWDPSATPELETLFNHLNIWYVMVFHLLNTNFSPLAEERFQIEHAYRIDLFPGTLDDRVYLYGFADHDIDLRGGGDRHGWVHEHQFNIRLLGGLHAIAQIRHEDFLPDQTGFGVGVEHVVNF